MEISQDKEGCERSKQVKVSYIVSEVAVNFAFCENEKRYEKLIENSFGFSKEGFLASQKISPNINKARRQHKTNLKKSLWLKINPQENNRVHF